MEHFLKHIDDQININKGKNLFYKGSESSLEFIGLTERLITEIQGLDGEKIRILCNYAAEKALEELCRVNQYFSFDSTAVFKLQLMYKKLIHEVQNLNEGHSTIEEIAKVHYVNLKNWLLESNSFSEKLYDSRDTHIEAVACAEYSPELQLSLLKIDISSIKQPVLDIGCGKKGGLVHHLRTHNIEAYGFDRFAANSSFISQADWLKYEFGDQKWGTIISNLGFSNHFNHHHLRKDGDFLEYAQKYMEILNSLQKNGRFIYAPGLPFIEKYLQGDYKLEKFETGIANHHVSHVIKL